jgi:hypothetical protein
MEGLGVASGALPQLLVALPGKVAERDGSQPSAFGFVRIIVHDRELARQAIEGGLLRQHAKQAAKAEQKNGEEEPFE